MFSKIGLKNACGLLDAWLMSHKKYEILRDYGIRAPEFYFIQDVLICAVP
jgi:hypothetical protein